MCLTPRGPRGPLCLGSSNCLEINSQDATRRYLIYSTDHRGVHYVFIVFEEVFVGIVHLIYPIVSLPIVSISVNFWENRLTDA